MPRAGYLGLIGKACLDQDFPSGCLMHRVNPGHYRPLIERPVKGARIDVSRHLELPAHYSHAQPGAVHRATPVVDKLMLQQVIAQLPLNQLLALRRVGTVIAAGHTGVGTTRPGCYSLQLPVTEPLKERVRPITFDGPDFLPGQQVVDHHSRCERKGTLLLGLAFAWQHVVVGRALFDVHDQGCTDTRRDPLALFVILDIRQTDQYGMQ
ncbi:hypothetical protein D3C77_462600 [compost metagenome]